MLLVVTQSAAVGSGSGAVSRVAVRSNSAVDGGVQVPICIWFVIGTVFLDQISGQFTDYP